MAIKTFCDVCDRDISEHDRFRIDFQGGRRGEILMRKFAVRDLCVQCARTLDINKMLEEVER